MGKLFSITTAFIIKSQTSIFKYKNYALNYKFDGYHGLIIKQLDVGRFKQRLEMRYTKNQKLQGKFCVAAKIVISNNCFILFLQFHTYSKNLHARIASVGGWLVINHSTVGDGSP